MNNNIYMNPHPHQVPQPQVRQQPMQQMQHMPMPPNISIVNTNYGPMYFDSNTGQYIDPRQMQMQPQQVVQRPMHPQQMMAFQRGAQPHQQFHPQARLMGGQTASFTYDQGSETQDNRFDGPARQLQTLQPSSQDNTQMRIPTNQANTVSIIQQKKFVPGKKLLKSKSVSFLPRTRPFLESEVDELHLNVMIGGFSGAVETLYEEACQSKEKGTVALIGKCVLAEAFYESSLRSLTVELFQSDIELVYRFMKEAVDNLTTRGDVVFMSEYNQWLTDQVNDILRVLTTEPIDIDSFVEDFNDLKKFLGEKATVNPKMETIYKEICRRMKTLMLSAIDLHKPDRKETDVEISPDAVYLVEKCNIVFCKMMSTELWKDGVPDTEPEGNRLMSSLAEHVKEEIFYVLTLDKVVYKVIVTITGTVIVDMIGN